MIKLTYWDLIKNKYSMQELEANVNHLGYPSGTDVDTSREFYPAGQGAGAVSELIPAGKLVRDIVAQAEEILQKLARIK